MELGVAPTWTRKSKYSRATLQDYEWMPSSTQPIALCLVGEAWTALSTERLAPSPDLLAECRLLGGGTSPPVNFNIVAPSKKDT
jgi:hypothetical protein